MSSHTQIPVNTIATEEKKNANPHFQVYKQNVTYKVDVLIADVYSRVNFESLQICPHFTDFEFTNWTRNREVLSLIPPCFFVS